MLNILAPFVWLQQWSSSLKLQVLFFFFSYAKREIKTNTCKTHLKEAASIIQGADVGRSGHETRILILIKNHSCKPLKIACTAEDHQLNSPPGDSYNTAQEEWCAPAGCATYASHWSTHMPRYKSTCKDVIGITILKKGYCAKNICWWSTPPVLLRWTGCSTLCSAQSWAQGSPSVITRHKQSGQVGQNNNLHKLITKESSALVDVGQQYSGALWTTLSSSNTTTKHNISYPGAPASSLHPHQTNVCLSGLLEIFKFVH